ncbi:MAG: alanine racemase [Chloroflexi bacterium]|nr:alanine racemase [Chloroflexota bacterium]MCH8870250.1 alanine racemase [Chloroflexota bacterium]
MDNYRPLVGTSLANLDTPCLMVDLDALEHNYDVIARTYSDTECKMRLHTKNLKSPLLAHMQIRAGGTVGGVCTAKVAEAEVMVEGGIDDILIPNQVVTRDKIVRLCTLAKRAKMMVAADNADNIREISEIAQEHGVKIGIVVEVDTQMHRAGVRDTQTGVDLARVATDAPGIDFRGVMCHQAAKGFPDRETRFIEGRQIIQTALDVRDAIETAGMPVEVVSAGETWTYDLCATIPGVTEVEGGTYALMSHGYAYMEEFEFAATILGTVISTPRPGVAIGDTGSRCLGSPGGVLPQLVGMPGIVVDSLQEEHIVLRSEGEMPLKLGGKYQLISGQQDIMVNRWDQYIAMRKGSVEAVWDIPGRGCHN